MTTRKPKKSDDSLQAVALPNVICPECNTSMDVRFEEKKITARCHTDECTCNGKIFTVTAPKVKLA